MPATRPTHSLLQAASDHDASGHAAPGRTVVGRATPGRDVVGRAAPGRAASGYTLPAGAPAAFPAAFPATAAPLDPGEVAKVLGAGVPLLVGRIRIDLETGDCQWSPEVEVMHGTRRGRRPSLDLLRSALHPDDQGRVAAAVVDSARRGRPFAAAHRVVDSHGRAHTLVVVSGAHDRRGAVECAVVDVTPAQREAVARERDGAVNRAMVARTVVERAVGALMALTAADEAGATAMLQETAARVGVTTAEAATQVIARLCAADDERRPEPSSLTAMVRDALDSVIPVARHDAALLARRRTRCD